MDARWAPRHGAEHQSLRTGAAVARNASHSQHGKRNARDHATKPPETQGTPQDKKAGREKKDQNASKNACAAEWQPQLITKTFGMQPIILGWVALLTKGP